MMVYHTSNPDTLRMLIPILPDSGGQDGIYAVVLLLHRGSGKLSYLHHLARVPAGDGSPMGEKPVKLPGWDSNLFDRLWEVSSEPKTVNTVREAISLLRRRMGLSQKDFADRAGLCVPVVYSLEAGRYRHRLRVEVLAWLGGLAVGLGMPRTADFLEQERMLSFIQSRDKGGWR